MKSHELHMKIVITKGLSNNQIFKYLVEAQFKLTIWIQNLYLNMQLTYISYDFG